MKKNYFLQNRLVYMASPEGKPEAQAEAAKKAAGGAAAVPEELAHAEKFKSNLGAVGKLHGEAPVGERGAAGGVSATEAGKGQEVAGPKGSGRREAAPVAPAEPVKTDATIALKEVVLGGPAKSAEKSVETPAEKKAKLDASAAKIAAELAGLDTVTTNALKAGDVNTEGVIGGETPDLRQPPSAEIGLKLSKQGPVKPIERELPGERFAAGKKEEPPKA